jgi:hypothetical protein
MMLPSDIVRYIEHSYVAEEAAEAIRLLEGAVLHNGAPADARCLRSALVGSSGSLSELKELIALLKIDFRDVIMAGEYEGNGRQLCRFRDLNEPFQLDND